MLNVEELGILFVIVLMFRWMNVVGGVKNRLVEDGIVNVVEFRVGEVD